MDKLTRDDIENMDAGREMDALIAERVMGFSVLKDPESAISNGCRVSEGLWVVVEFDAHEWGHSVMRPDPYSIDIKSAQMVVFEMQKRFPYYHNIFWMDPKLIPLIYDISIRRQWQVDFQGSGILAGYGETLALAICRAALIATLEAQP